MSQNCSGNTKTWKKKKKPKVTHSTKMLPKSCWQQFWHLAVWKQIYQVTHKKPINYMWLLRKKYMDAF